MAKSQKKKPPKNKGFGRKSTIDLLPEEADEDILWVNEELHASKRLQIDILEEFNSRLADKGLPLISKGAFSRYSVRKAKQFREMDETRRLSIDLAEMMGADSADKMTIAVAEMTKVAAIKLLEQGKLTPQDVHFLSRAAKDASAAQKISTDLRLQIEKENFTKAAKVAASSAKKAGVSDEAIAIIERDVLGLAK